jgi:hypothetical protein
MFKPGKCGSIDKRSARTGRAGGFAMNALHASLLVLSTLIASAAATAQQQLASAAEESARGDFESALRMWQDGLYGGLLFYHDGHGPLSPLFYASMDAGDGAAARPVEWSVTSIDCPTGTECTATAVIRFTGEETGGLRRYRLVRDPGQFWGLYSEEILRCPEGYRLQYQGVCFNVADERSNALEVRTADPVLADPVLAD